VEIKLECEDDVLLQVNEVVLVVSDSLLFREQIDHSVEGWRNWLFNLCCHQERNGRKHCKVWCFLSFAGEECEVPVGDVASQVHSLLLVPILLLVQALNSRDHSVSLLRGDAKLVGMSQIVSDDFILIKKHVVIAALRVFWCKLT